MRELISFIAGIITITFIGFNVLFIIRRTCKDLYNPEAFFISYGIGIGCVSLEMLIFYILGKDFSINRLLVPWIFLVAANSILYIKSDSAALFPKQTEPNDTKNSLLNTFLLAGITIETVYAFFRAVIKPIESYDAIAIYAIKSKIFFLAKGIPENYFPALAHAFPHPDYPLNIPLIESFMYSVMRNLNDQVIKLIFPLFFAGILCMLYFAIRRFASRTYALLFTFLLASIPQVNAYATNAYQELPMAFYYFVSALFLFAWLEKMDDLRALTLSAVMVAFAGWTKNEGLLYCVINTALVMTFALIDKKNRTWRTVVAPIIYIAIIGLITAPWLYIKHKYGIVNDEINLANCNPVYLMKQLPKLGPIFYELQKQLFGPKKWILLWPVVIAVIALKWKKLFTGVQKYITISLLLAFCGYILFYMISYVDVVFFASKTWSRFLLHFIPLVVLWLAYILKEDIKI